MGYQGFWRAAFWGALGICLASGAGAQSVTFGLDQRFEVDDNLALDLDSAGTSYQAITGLSFGYKATTPIDTFSLQASALWRAVEGPSDVRSGFDNQRITLGYTREGARAEFGVDASYRRADVAYLRPFEDFIDEEGNLILPEDLADLTGAGTRESWAVNANLETGRDMPMGFTLDAGLSGIQYRDTTNPNLTDIDRAHIAAGLRLNLSPVLTGNLGARFATYDADDAAGTYRETTSATLGLTYAASPILTLQASLGYSIIDTEEFGITTTTEGLDLRLGGIRELPNGTISAEISRRVTADGRRLTAQVARSMELPNGALSASIGATSLDGGDPDLIAALNWQHALPTGVINARLSRDVRETNTDSESLTTSLAIGYAYQINANSGLDFNASYIITDESVPGARVDRATLTAAYRHALTPDWNLYAGYRHRMRDDEGIGRAQSNMVFMSIGRQFDLLP